MLKRNVMKLALVGTATLFAMDLSPCGPAGELLELILPTILIGLAT